MPRPFYHIALQQKTGIFISRRRVLSVKAVCLFVSLPTVKGSTYCLLTPDIFAGRPSSRMIQVTLLGVRIVVTQNKIRYMRNVQYQLYAAIQQLVATLELEGRRLVLRAPRRAPKGLLRVLIPITTAVSINNIFLQKRGNPPSTRRYAGCRYRLRSVHGSGPCLRSATANCCD